MDFTPVENRENGTWSQQFLNRIMYAPICGCVTLLVCCVATPTATANDPHRRQTRRLATRTKSASYSRTTWIVPNVNSEPSPLHL